ncbi:hypothetical protein [Burkholderia stabilis]|uniref:hypothetical protein n=1 Tax=Burkholderia stabilis TaxID=95485 RepID=UPI001F4A595D|nr:hypothetical protein [Burkholderia stabilis]
MIDGIDWDAPIEPGRAMLGLTLGLSDDAVRRIVGCDADDQQKIVEFKNSPRLLVDCRRSDVIFIRSADIKNIMHEWQNVLARLVFDDYILKSIVVESVPGGAEYVYRGRIMNKVCLGMKVAELRDFGFLEYDDVDEVFYLNEVSGLEVAGDDVCDLSINPNQVVAHIKIFQSMSA